MFSVSRPGSTFSRFERVSTYLTQFQRSTRFSKIVREYDQEIPQSQTADKPMTLREGVTQQSRDTRKLN